MITFPNRIGTKVPVEDGRPGAQAEMRAQDVRARGEAETEAEVASQARDAPAGAGGDTEGETEAEARAASIRAEADAYAAGVRAEADAYAASVREQALARAEAEAASEGRARAHKIATEHLANYLAVTRTRANLNLYAPGTDRSALASAGEAARMARSLEQSATRVNALQRERTEELLARLADVERALVTEVTGSQAALVDELRAYRSSLYTHEFQPIATCYTDLCRILDNNKFLTPVIGALAASESPEVVRAVEDLKRLDASLTRFQAKFKDALGALGLFARMPAAGARYNPAFMEAVDEPERPERALVARCLAPAILRSVDGGRPEDGDVVLRALVQLDQ